jgi:hypothetical protein
MNASSVLANPLQSHLNEVQAASDLHPDDDEPVRVFAVLSPDDLPPDFEDILQIQVLGYRERLIVTNERRLHVLDPVWTLVPKDRWRD